MKETQEVKITKENFEALQTEAAQLGKAYVDALVEQIVRQGFSLSSNDESV